MAETTAQQTTQSNGQSSQAGSEADLVRQIAERVWELWQKELRLERERRGGFRR